MEIELVIFDLFGVLFKVNWGDMKQFLAENGVKNPDEKLFNKAFKEVFQLNRYDDLEIGVEALADKIDEKDNTKFKLAELEFLKNFRERIEIDEKAVFLIRFLKSVGFKVAILSNSFQINDDIQKELGMDKIDGVFLSCDTKKLKPNKDAFLNVCNHFGIEPQKCLLVGGDKDKDVAPARALGMRAICYNEIKA